MALGALAASEVGGFRGGAGVVGYHAGALAGGDRPMGEVTPVLPRAWPEEKASERPALEKVTNTS